MSQAARTDWWRPGPTAAVASIRPRDVGRAGGNLAFWCLVGFTLVLVLAPQQFIPLLGRLRLAFALALVAIVAHLSERARLVANHKPLEVRLVLAIVVVAVFGIPNSYWPGGSVETLTGDFFKSIAIFLLLGEVVSTDGRMRSLLWTLVACSAPLALQGLRNYLSGSFVRDRIVGYESGLASNPNDLALTLNLFIPLALALAVTARRSWQRLLAWGCVCLSVLAVVVTFSRAGFLTLVTESVLMLAFLVRRRATKAVAGLAFCAVVAMVLLPAGYLQRISTIASIESDSTGSSQERWADMVTAAKFVADHPVLGAGIGQGILALNEARGAAWVNVHNAYLSYGVDLGLPGLVLFVALVLTSYNGAKRVAALPSELVGDEVVAFAGATRISLAGFIVAAFFHPIAYHFYFYYIAGLSVAVNTIATRHASTKPPVG